MQRDTRPRRGKIARGPDRDPRRVGVLAAEHTGEDATPALFAAEHIAARTPGADERALAALALAAIPFAGPLAYARVDLIRDARGEPVVLELELAEPSLFFAYAPGSADRFARSLIARAQAIAARG